MKRWKCVTPCIWRNRDWAVGETTRTQVRPNNHFVEIHPNVETGKKEVIVGPPGGMAGAVMPKVDIPPDHGQIQVITVEDNEMPVDPEDSEDFDQGQGTAGGETPVGSTTGGGK